MSRRELELKKLYVLTPAYYKELIKNREAPEKNVIGLDAIFTKISNNQKLSSDEKWLQYRQALLNYKSKNSKPYVSPKKETPQRSKVPQSKEVSIQTDENFSKPQVKEISVQTDDDYENSKPQSKEISTQTYDVPIYNEPFEFKQPIRKPYGYQFLEKPNEEIFESAENNSNDTNQSRNLNDYRKLAENNKRRKVHKQLRFDESRSSLTNDENLDDSLNVRRLSSINPFAEDLSSSISELFNTAHQEINDDDDNEISFTTKTKPAVRNEELEFELHKFAQQLFDEADPKNVVRKDQTLGTEKREFIHLPSMKEISIDVLTMLKNLYPEEFPPQEVKSNKKNVSFEPMDTIPIKRKSFTPSKRKSITPKKRIYSYLELRNRDVKRRTSDSLDTLRKNLKDEKKRAKQALPEFHRILRVAARGKNKPWSRSNYSSLAELSKARVENLAQRTELFKQKWKKW